MQIHPLVGTSAPRLMQTLKLKGLKTVVRMKVTYPDLLEEVLIKLLKTAVHNGI